MRKCALILIIGLLLGVSPAIAADPDAVMGLWTTRDGKAKVEIFKCGERYCGKLAELKEPNYPANDSKGMGGKPKIDRENPSPALGARPLLGLQILQDFTFNGDTWEGGTIYDPENGKTYKCKMKIDGANKLDVRGFIGISMIGRTETWSR